MAQLLLSQMYLHVSCTNEMKTRIHLTIMQPPGYLHSQGFLDQARYARYQFRRLGAEVTIGKNRLRQDSVNIVFGAHLGFDASLKDRHTCVFFNLEQLGEAGAVVSPDYLRLLTTSAVMDYNEKNLPFYNCKPGDVPVVSFLAAPYLKNSDLTPLQDRPIDLLFFGGINDRRGSLISRIEACGWKVTTFDSPLFSDERDHFIRQSKAVLNCHFYKSNLFEQARAFHTLSLGIPLISERTVKTQPHVAYEDSVSWFDDVNLENFFTSNFMSAHWQENTVNQLDNFFKYDRNDDWSTALKFCEEFSILNLYAGGPDKIWSPKLMNLGSGKDYKMGWLNVDILERSQPDIILDLSKEIEFPINKKMLNGGNLNLKENSLDYVYANNVLEHVPDLPCLMGNILKLLKLESIFEIEVPYEKASTAWQDPTHLRAMNKNSWLYYTDWFWYLGWFEYRFEINHFSWLNSHHQVCEEEYAAFMHLKLRKIETTLNEKFHARNVFCDFGLKDDLIYEEKL